MHRLAPLFILLLTACPSDDKDGTKPQDTGDSGTEDTLPQPAPTVDLSSGECPELGATSTSSFLSSGVERTVTVVIPEAPGEDMPAVFFFHGLLDTSVEPTSYHADALQLQSVANAENAVFVLPQSRTMTQFGQTFYMWQVMDEDEQDLVLYDDLRTCIDQELSVDLRRLSALGFSGGALFATVLARERGDTLSTLVEMSGGSDIDFSLVSEDPIAVYDTPANTMPALLFSGGDEDGWPQGFVLVNFQDATDSLEANLVADGHYTWRCRHSMGHTITMPEWSLAKSWALGHAYGEPSPYVGGSIDDYSDWCTEFATE
jgi:poly(3-hydroxybutyrate) depolymerase